MIVSVALASTKLTVFTEVVPLSESPEIASYYTDGSLGLPVFFTAERNFERQHLEHYISELVELLLDILSLAHCAQVAVQVAAAQSAQ